MQKIRRQKIYSRIEFLSILGVVFAMGCVNTPVVRYSQVHVTNAASLSLVENYDYFSLIRKAQGRQIGDTIFKTNTSAYWIIPPVDLADLKLTAQEEGFETNEYQGRLTRILDTHKKYLIFLLDLRMPFYPAWTQEQLLGYLQNNLVVSLETGGDKLLFPEHEVFQIRERFQQQNEALTNGSNDLEVRVPIRVYFRKSHNSQSVISHTKKTIKLKLRLKESPPFHIGFFDEKFYQGFVWKVTRVEN